MSSEPKSLTQRFGWFHYDHGRNMGRAVGSARFLSLVVCLFFVSLCLVNGSLPITPCQDEMLQSNRLVDVLPINVLFIDLSRYTTTLCSFFFLLLYYPKSFSLAHTPFDPSKPQALDRLANSGFLFLTGSLLEKRLR